MIDLSLLTESVKFCQGYFQNTEKLIEKFLCKTGRSESESSESHKSFSRKIQKVFFEWMILKMTTKKMTTLVKQVIIFYEPSATLF